MREMGSSAAVWNGEVSAGGAGRGLLLIYCAQGFGLERGKKGQKMAGQLTTDSLKPMGQRGRPGA